MKVIPNCISFSRMIFSLSFLFIRPFSIPFYTVYIFCGLSDIMDGFIARKSGTTSKFGEKIDTMADMLMVVVLLALLYPIVNPSKEIFIWMISIAMVRLASMVVALKKYKTFAMLHTYGNKFTGLVVFMYPILFNVFHTTVLIYIICLVASISAIEELIIQLTSRQLQLNRQSILVKENIML